MPMQSIMTRPQPVSISVLSRQSRLVTRGKKGLYIKSLHYIFKAGHGKLKKIMLEGISSTKQDYIYTYRTYIILCKPSVTV